MNNYNYNIINKNNKINKKILVIDGGGIRGIIPLSFINYFSNNINGQFIDKFDYYSASSVGVIILCFLLYPESHDLNLKSLDDIKKIFFGLMKKIFTNSYYYTLKSFGGFYSSYDNNNLYNSLKFYFKSYKIKDLSKNIIIPIYDVKYNNVIIITNDKFPDMLLIDLIMCCVCAPTYFSPYNLKFNDKDMIFVDNSIISNCNSMFILNYLNNKYDNYNYLLVNLGTGYCPIDYKNNLINLAYIIPNLFMYANEELSLYSGRMLLNNNYYKLNINIDNKLYVLDSTNENIINTFIVLVDNFINDNKIIFNEIIQKIN
jgi:patatin-like phospholipase/acyl hydrolase